MTDYSSMFAHHDRNRAWRQGHAAAIVEMLWAYHQPQSSIDLGCGMGFFLAALAAKGAKIRAVDGPWVKDLDTEIPKSRYTLHDLNEPFRTRMRYDIAVSLEVGEHLDPGRTDGLVEDLTRLSDHVLFSAAIPGQKGKGHINCRWQGDWAEHFAARGYRCYDPFRRRLMAVEDMAPWFMQNLLFFVKDGVKVSPLLAEHEIPPRAASYILPRWHEQRVNFLVKQLKGAQAMLRAGKSGAKAAMGDKLIRLGGIGAKQANRLRKEGITRFAQIAEWDADQTAWAEDTIGPLRGGVSWSECVAKAQALAAESRAAPPETV